MVGPDNIIKLNDSEFNILAVGIEINNITLLEEIVMNLKPCL